MVEIPQYENYSLLELYQVLNFIRADLVPHVHEALTKEIASREPASVLELEDCYFALDREKNPEYAARLIAQINERGGFSVNRREEITADNRYRTFWRRFWALFFDGFVVGIPILLLVLGLQSAGIVEKRPDPYLSHFLQALALTYYIAMHAAFGQTVGKMITGVRVMHESEESGISTGQAIMRDIVPVCSMIASLAYLALFGMPPEDASLSGVAAAAVYAAALAQLAWSLAEILTMLFNARRRALHDFIARTVVVRIA